MLPALLCALWLTGCPGDDGAAGTGVLPDDTQAVAGMGATGSAAAPDLSANPDLIAGGSSSAVRPDADPVLCPSPYVCEDLMGFPVR